MASEQVTAIAQWAGELLLSRFRKDQLSNYQRCSSSFGKEKNLQTFIEGKLLNHKTPPTYQCPGKRTTLKWGTAKATYSVQTDSPPSPEQMLPWAMSNIHTGHYFIEFHRQEEWSFEVKKPSHSYGRIFCILNPPKRFLLNGEMSQSFPFSRCLLFSVNFTSIFGHGSILFLYSIMISAHKWPTITEW